MAASIWILLLLLATYCKRLKPFKVPSMIFFFFFYHHIHNMLDDIDGNFSFYFVVMGERLERVIFPVLLLLILSHF